MQHRILEEGFKRPDEFNYAPFNPAYRIEEKSIKHILDTMKRDGFWPEFHIKVGNDGFVADGHGRIAAARVLGITQVPYQVIDVDSQTLWAEINGSVRPITAKAVAQAVARGLEVYPANQKTTILEVLNTIGEEGMKRIAEANLSPRIIQRAKQVARYVGRKNDKDFIYKVVCWMIDHKLQVMVAFALDHRTGVNFDPQILLMKIENDQPISLI